MGGDGSMEMTLEPLTDELIAEMNPLNEAHYQEVSRKDIFEKLDVDWDFYKSIALKGFLRVFTLRDAKKLVGYWFFVVKLNPHYKTKIMGIDDVLFVHPDFRGKSAYEFMKYVLEAVKTETHVVTTRCKTYFDLERVYSGLDMEVFEKGFICKGNL